jgi:uncharacterized repeat protein (TIGR03803 family)
LALAVAANAWAASKEQVLYNFKGAPDGAYPAATIAFDGNGNLYGTTYQGGLYYDGIVFQLSPSPNGRWSESVLHSFNEGNGDGAYPEGSLLVDASGDLYGTTLLGGDGPCSVTCGTVFELSPPTNGGWIENILDNFNGTDGANPADNLVVGRDGSFYGTTQNGGEYGRGTAFKLAKGTDGAWNETVLYSFTGEGEDGIVPTSGLMFDRFGNLYGTTYAGGNHNKGIAFELRQGAKGEWTEAVLHSFDGRDGAYPVAGLVTDTAGNIYGGCPNEGPRHNGVVFKLTRGRNNRWAFTILYDFPRHKDGWGPVGTLIRDPEGNLYGVTAAGGNTACESGCGTVFKMSPRADGRWSYAVLHRFNGHDGELPEAGLIWDMHGNLYGTTFYGGTNGGGAAFEITP